MGKKLKNVPTFEQMEEMNELMETMGFEKVGGSDAAYWHTYFGRHIEFDFYAIDKDTHSIMAHIFKVITEYGKVEKNNEIKKVLDI